MSRVIVVKQGPKRAVIAAGLRGAKGEAGEQGLPFQVDAQGLLANRSAFDAEPAGFSYLAIDTGELYFREGAAGGWSAGVPFQGPPGDSAYQVAVENGFVGTEAEWLETLQGDTGDEGRGITSLAINISGHLVVTYTDTTQTDLGLAVGADGANGANGTNGTNGEDGRGIASMAIDGSYHLIITYDDATTEDAGLIPGAGGSTAWGSITGTLADQTDLQTALNGKVNTDGAKVLSDENYTAAEKSKLGGVADNANNYSHPNHTGDVTSVGDGALTIANDAVTNAKLANMATATIKGRTTAGTGDPEDLSAAQVRAILNVAEGATANQTDAHLKDRANHTGSQLASTISDFATSVRSTVLSGLSLADSTVVAATDSVLQAIGKLAARLATAFSRANHTGEQAISTVTGLQAALDSKQATLVSGTNIKSVNGTSLLGSGDLTVTGGSTAPGKNLVINGAFQVKQGAPAVTSGTVTLTAGQYGWLSTVKGFDRWKAGASGCTYTFSTTGGVTSIDITAGSLQQVIEGRNLVSGDHVMSWSGTAQGKIGGGSYSASGVTASVTGGSDLTVEFNAGTLSNVQFELGTVATSFERRLFSAELQMCKRYFPMFLAIGTGTQFISTAYVFSSPQISIAYQFDVEPRIPPTGVIVSAPGHFNVNAGGGGAGPATAVTFNSASSKAARLLATASGAITTGGGAEFFANGTNGAYLYFTGCEL